ncbi:MAG: FtsX-like permease family protein [Blastocatellia bacterium]|nr:FtsX-like permease family protein [Blastocatellia bacterium]
MHCWPAICPRAGRRASIPCTPCGRNKAARGAGRERELAIRAALGSGRWRIVQMQLAESLLLVLIGGALGVALAWPGLQALLKLIPVELLFWMKIELNWPVLLFSLAATMVTGVIFGLAPALHLSRVDLQRALKDGTKGASNGTGAQRLRNGLIVVEVAFSLVLLVGAGLRNSKASPSAGDARKHDLNSLPGRIAHEKRTCSARPLRPVQCRRRARSSSA